jgi:hypothetical protein
MVTACKPQSPEPPTEAEAGEADEVPAEDEGDIVQTTEKIASQFELAEYV